MPVKTPTEAAQAALSRIGKDVEVALDEWLPKATTEPTRLHEAMRYSTLGGGKRVRPALAVLACEAAGREGKEAMPAGVALECIHVYSLVHDDLPAMDDDDLRRGRPTNHKVYGDAMAILVGDGLQALAFEVLTRAYAGSRDPRLVSDLVRLLAEASGSIGMVGGQAIDIASHTLAREEAALEGLHRRKTGALLRASVLMGARVAGVDEDDPRWPAFDAYARALGLAFQVADDVLDATQSAEQLGKTPGKDAAQGKLTYVALLGIDGARKKAAALERAAHEALAPLAEWGETLKALATFVVSRTS